MSSTGLRAAPAQAAAHSRSAFHLPAAPSGRHVAALLPSSRLQARCLLQRAQQSLAWPAASRGLIHSTRCEASTGAAVPPWKEKNARLVLADGSVWYGVAFGATGKAVGEVVFNTSMSGYQVSQTVVEGLQIKAHRQVSVLLLASRSELLRHSSG